MSVDDLETLASFLYERHGAAAVWYIGHAVDQLEARGDRHRAETWRIVHNMMMDMAGTHFFGDASNTVH